MLSIMSLASQGACGDELARQKKDSLEERRKQIFRLYVDQMFERKGTTYLPFPREKTIGWLSCLAGKMKEHSQSVFLVEALQPSWLRTRAEGTVYRALVPLSLGAQRRAQHCAHARTDAGVDPRITRGAGARAGCFRWSWFRLLVRIAPEKWCYKRIDWWVDLRADRRVPLRADPWFDIRVDRRADHRPDRRFRNWLA